MLVYYERADIDGFSGLVEIRLPLAVPVVTKQLEHVRDWYCGAGFRSNAIGPGDKYCGPWASL